MAAGITPEQAADAALSLPDSIEAGHHGRRSFRVGGAIFATLWDADHMNVMLDEPGIRTAVQAHPEACAEFWWGRRLRAVQVDLRRARAGLVSELLADAWEQRTGRPAAETATPPPSTAPRTARR